MWNNGYVPPIRMGLEPRKSLNNGPQNLNSPLEMGSFLTCDVFATLDF